MKKYFKNIFSKRTAIYSTLSFTSTENKQLSKVTNQNQILKKLNIPLALFWSNEDTATFQYLRDPSEMYVMEMCTDSYMI